MQKAVSTYVYVKERLHPGLLDGLVRGGAQAVEIFAARVQWPSFHCRQCPKYAFACESESAYEREKNLASGPDAAVIKLR